MARSLFLSFVFAVALLLAPGAMLYAQDGTSSGPSTDVISVNPYDFHSRRVLCGGTVQAGTPIAANSPPAAGNKTSGSITIAGVPATATVVRADLFWTVLTSTPLPNLVGAAITFAGAPVVGLQIGAAPQSPCFPQANSVAYRAIVTGLVPGNGVYAVSGFPGGPLVTDDYTEGATLQVVWTDPNAPLRQHTLHHMSPFAPAPLLPVTTAELFTQFLPTFPTNAAGPVAARLFEVIGNGQTNGVENLRYDGPCAGDINLDNSLDGSTVARPPASCSGTIGVECFWDDDVHNVSAQYACAAGNSAVGGTLSSDPNVSPTNDCFDWPALALDTSMDPDTVCRVGGGAVDVACPTDAAWANHGDYVSCVSEAAQRFLSWLPFDGTCPRAEIQSCIVNPRARSDVGKPKK